MRLTVVQLKRLIGNPDVYALQGPGGQWHPHRAPLTDAVLRSQLDDTQTVGTYVLRGNRARTLVFDIDVPGDEGLKQANQIRDALHDLGIPRPKVGIEDSGNKGFHVWVVISDYIDATNLRRIGRAALAIAGVQCEVFPKQDEARDLGNLIGLPGGINRKSGRRREMLTRFPLPITPAGAENIIAALPEVSAPTGGSRPEPFQCVCAAQKGLSEGLRNQGLFQLAVMLRRASVSDEHVEHIVRHAAEQAKPPYDDQPAIDLLLESSRHSGPICRQLEGSDIHCGEQCILNRSAGLKTRAGQVRYAQEGESVVVTVRGHRGRRVDIEHPDLTQAEGVVRE